MKLRSGQVDAFVRAQLAADDDAAINIWWNDFLNTQLDVAVGEQNRIAGLHFVGQALQRNRYALTVARDVIGCQDEFLFRLKLDKSVFNRADPDLRSLQVLKNRHRLVQYFSNALDLPHQIAMVLGRPV